MDNGTVVFIHGMYMSSLCWENWIKYFASNGYHCLAPAWPGRDQPVDSLRKLSHDPQLACLTLNDVIRHYSDIIHSLPGKPILIGHSMGGLVVQVLLQKEQVSAGVAIDSAPPMGVLSASWPFLRSNWPHITPFVSQDNPVEMSFPRFQYTFTNDMPSIEQQAAFNRYVVPESRRVPRQSLTTRVDFQRTHAPLLMIAGASDHLIPASLNRRNFNRYQPSPSRTDYKEFSGRTHFIIGQDGWEEVAGYITGWLSLL
jgi:pimeloyl-ACP methyl ester carboxylesterase